MRIPLLIVFCTVLNTAVRAQLENLGKTVNTEFNEIAPIISPDGKTLYFSRISHPQNTNGTKGSQDIWFSELKNDKWSTARRLPTPLNKEEYNSLYSITPDGNTLLIKGAYKNGTYETRGFSTSKKTARGWTAPSKMEIPGYAKTSKGQFDCGFLSADGKVLVMSFSEKKNSKVDNLYVSFKQKDGSWSKPMDLGKEINTDEFTETTPFLAPDGVTLYFSTDRKGGQGSNDIYYSKRLDKSWKRWSRPVNLGADINTDGYDAYYTISAAGDYAYMVSFKDTEGKGDIVRYNLQPKADPQILAKSAETPQTPGVSGTNDSTRITGITGAPGTTGVAATTETTGVTGANSTTNVTGTPGLTGTTGISGTNGTTGVTGTSGDTTIPQQAGVSRSTADPVVLITGKVIDSRTSKPIEANIIYETLPEGEEAGTATTSPTTGEYKIILPYGQKYSMRAEAPNFIAEEESVDLTDSTTAEGGKSYREINNKSLKLVPIEKGQVVRLNNIFFAFAKATLNKASYPELDRISASMKNNKNLFVEIAGHTDNIGGDESNLKLSQDRADAVRTYLIGKGIEPDRITGIGYGETSPIASNDTPEGQRNNRRVELKILKK